MAARLFILRLGLLLQAERHSDEPRRQMSGMGLQCDDVVVSVSRQMESIMAKETVDQVRCEQSRWRSIRSLRDVIEVNGGSDERARTELQQASLRRLVCELRCGRKGRLCDVMGVGQRRRRMRQQYMRPWSE